MTWRTVRRALDGQWPQERRKPRRRESRPDPYKPPIDGIPQADTESYRLAHTKAQAERAAAS
ncbi:hypothetical protein [Streptomyces acidiscabies]|uniref:Uncharacterized protein n=1 Tax=Streptomyces acidiscabies TaxID=42234 RepID=A0AAP6EG56_9ACTN|nr:hypothetical protein [Streptomyces acidiscabies]MBP5942490.1 hypothetical protein [Streptomyces sp. LBUM 1476]MBZ3917759.1 hypothetical protein [Streptomyces acidiscabies]MDX2961727.1 hypothetical protein [Streptomyces acidiscabies]MDX3023526.1 hypothetical protein [Streptomyces acidiscabies]MDX3789268.1 hypothetical protein [Streptomyces acidiscabies]